ncbi:MAG: heavy metal-associated domain-containing protein [Schaalia hyovaginalis]|uniref:heavy-metal-associated domain-containing protein n=1 Tax=Schaalia TaxID=2529408 RepID=UPI0012B2826F|nr:heavy metal-associated domain-containing protein [Schaalia hyovaginalis]MCF2712044.1 heavy-metal-associated domain-containing protein [Schaalia hyovaginalis]MCI6411957.1 heavy-metal-associated domain-containing protein [Schaalia hyovaginalis]MCI6556323.1 heavy-metal-associated domain-containing protein [Schaalia hyovaginalis]MCI7512018.1 heavy-metal-associated domain-containing protein [Schaalia hyovaginalis]MDD7554053.1 heavy metal-associated domain-containing protein [Schaalia hyovaginali
MTMEIDRTVELAVNGMTCGHCVASVTEELEAVDGVKHVDVILESGGTSKVTVLSDTLLDDDALREAVSEAGFELVGITRDF